MSVARKILFPILHNDLWMSYKQALDCMWKVEEVDLSKDYDDYKKLTKEDRHFIEIVLAFFVVSDSIVNINIIEHMQRAVVELEAQYFYNQQVLIEGVHTEMYCLLIHTLIRNEKKRAQLFNGFEEMPCVRKKAEWAMKYVNDNNITLAERLIAFAIVEGIFFSGSFAAIFYIKTKGLMPGLTFSNELISRDEGLHTKFACLYYNTRIENKLDAPTVYQMFSDAVEIEKEFFKEALPKPLVGMNATMMAQYIEFVADGLLNMINLPKYFHAENPFEFMNNISLEGKTNFFEKRVGEYKRFGAGEDAFQLLTDF